MLVLCVLLLMGCVSDQNSYNANLQNWVGMSQETLYESWGTPTNELYVGPNEKVVTYLQIDEDGPLTAIPNLIRATKCSTEPLKRLTTAFRPTTAAAITAKPVLPL